jgi:hypothetical protein
MEHQRQLGELYRYLYRHYVMDVHGGWVSREIDNRAYREAMEVLPFKVLEP